MKGTQKGSISVDAADLTRMRQRARRGGGNLSAVFGEAARLLRKREARHSVLAELGDAARLTPADLEAIRAQWRG